ncbi:MAG: substrate-binding domain-containing protein [Nitrospirota bacterium]
MTLKAVFFLFLSLPLAIGQSAYAETRIRCASTTSTQNSGLFDYILPVFEKKTGIKVDVVAVGTGAALGIGKRGDADLVFVHAKEDELKLVKDGYFVNRHDVMYNDFILVGPKDDPAGIKGTKDSIQALRKIYGSGSLFISRGDDSGTHKKEIELWKTTGLSPQGLKWHLSAGSGMEKTLRIANEKMGYCLTDRGTWLATKDRNRFDLLLVLENDPPLFNQYGVMAVSPERHKHIKYREAMAFINWLISSEGQHAIASFKDSHGNQLFFPNAK